MRKARILSLLLSVVMVFSICAAPISAVFAEDSVDLASSNSAVVGWTSTESFVDSVINFAKKDDKESSDSIIDGELVTTIISLILDDGTPEKEITSKDLLDKLTAMDKKIDEYHSELVVMLTDMGIKNEIRDYDITMLELFAQRETIHTAMSSIEEDQEIQKLKDGNEEEKKAASNNLIDYYKTIIKRCEDAQLLNNYNKAIALVTKSSTSTKKAFEGAYELMKSKTDDADQLSQSYKKYIYSQMAELGMAYMDVSTYWKAKIKLQQLDPKSTSEKDLKHQLKLAHSKLKELVNTEFKAAEERYNVINKANVESVKKDGTRTTANYDNFAVAWKAAKDDLKNGSKVTFTLNQDWLANNKNGFVDKTPFTDTDKEGCFTAKGEIIIPSGELTINLNGHKISGENLDFNIFQVSNDANVTINGLEEQTQGLLDGKSAITYAGGEHGNVRINLNNVWMQNFKEYGIDAGYDTSTVNLNYNRGGINNTQNGAIRLRGKIKFDINNCEFSNNHSGNDSGVFGCEEVSGQGSFKNCAFNNNSGLKAGAICGSVYLTLNIEGCTFNKNSSTSSVRGAGAISNADAVKDCTFTDNSSAFSGGALYYVGKIDHCTFTGNECNKDGGAIHLSTNDRYNNKTSIIDSTFTGNRSKTGNGGAIYYDQNTVEIKNCKFEKNSAISNGGAVYAGSSDDLFVYNSTFTRNTVESCGGAICTRDRCRAIIEGSEFTGNSSTKWDGGALFLTGLISQHHSLTNVTITGNTAAHRGGGVYCHKDRSQTGDFDVKGRVVIDGNTAQNKQSNVLLEQAGGVKKCIIDAKWLSNGSKIGISTDCKNRLTVVYNAPSASLFYGDNGREIIGNSGDLKIKEQAGGCK